MSSSLISDNTTQLTPDQLADRKKPNLIRNSTTPTSFDTPPKSSELHRQMSSSPSITTTPLSAMSAYLKHLLGFSAKTTKRSLSEEAECGSPDSLNEWLRQGSDPNEIDAYGYTPLINASLRGCTKSVKILLSHGADVNMKAMHGYSALHAAAQNGFVELAELLIDNSADVEAKNDDGDTPLMLAVRSEHPAVVDLLCKRGCNIHAHGFDNIEPIDYAINKRNLYLSDVLMKHERQHFNSSSSSTGTETHIPQYQNQNSIVKNNNEDLKSTEDLKSSQSLTTLLHKQQEEHIESQQHNDSVFQSD